MNSQESMPVGLVPTYCFFNVQSLSNEVLCERVLEWAEQHGGRETAVDEFITLEMPFLRGDLLVYPDATHSVERAVRHVETALSSGPHRSAHRAIAMPLSLARCAAANAISTSRGTNARLWWLFVDRLGDVVTVPPPGYREPPSGCIAMARPPHPKTTASAPNAGPTP